jgi:predicted transcriptional regulator
MTLSTIEKIAALGDPTRRQIFEILVTQPASVGRIASQFPITRSAVSQHLRVLKEAGLVKHETFGTRNVYYVDVSGVASLRNYFDSLWQKALTDFKTAAERSLTRRGKRKETKK